LHHKIRSKLVLFTVLPVLAVYLGLFWLGLNYIGQSLTRNAHSWLVEHTRHQASRLAMVLSQVPNLAEGLGDLLLADPEQDTALLYAHLIDGLRRTPIAQSAGLVFGTPARVVHMRRGESPASIPHSGEQPRQALGPGWHLLDGVLRFERRILQHDREVGLAWVELAIDAAYAALEADGGDAVTRLLAREDGAVLWPPLPSRAFAQLAPLLRQAAPADRVHTVATGPENTEFWLVTSPLQDTPWQLSAAIEAEAALAPVRRESQRAALVLLLSLFAIVLIISVVARRITRPLATLDASVRRIARGDFAVAPQVSSNDELGALARAIQTMAEGIADRERQLRSAQRVLEQRVNERTAALQASNLDLTRQIEQTRAAEEALRRATAQAEQANRAKSEFLSNMSHELRTPLHGVLGYTQLLLREADPDSSQRGALIAIERSGQHLLTLINDILDMSRIEAGQLKVEPQPTDLRQLLADVHAIVAQRARSKGLQLDFDLAADTPDWIVTDGLRLRQILLNLLGNAVKFTARGQITLGVSRHEPESLCFEVTDTGVGIPGEHIEAIFEAFHQLPQGQAVDGTGLGLAINQRLIRLLGGQSMQVDSAPGAGSRFRFCLPYQAVESAPLPTAADTVRLGAWPASLARAGADRIESALDFGDATSLFELVEEIQADPAVPPEDTERIARLARQFDFDGLRELARALRRAAAAADSPA
jgi:signal transduction histidine kinase